MRSDVFAVKESISGKLMELEKKFGVATAIKVARASLRVARPEAELKRQYNGEISESALEMLIKDWARGCGADVAWIKGLILPDRDGNKEFLTEIDMVVFTPWCVYCIECKSYSGDKKLLGAGTIHRANGMCYDVYKQNAMHLSVLDKTISLFGKRTAYQMVLFNFSHGTLEDLRSKSAREHFPAVDETSLFQVLRVNPEKVWDMKGLKLAIPKLTEFSKRNRGRHLQYVKSLKEKR